ncbi:MAG: protein-disulfide reductase DsbD domain-containing protein [Chthoniobacteraceae bacterium]
MYSRRWLLSLLALALIWAAPARAQFDLKLGGDKVLVTPSLIADTTKIAAGKPFTVGVRMQLAPGWHTYWQHPGESGAPPKITWELPEGFHAGEIQWPIPQAHLDEGDLLTYIYDGELVLPVEITPPATLPAGDVTLKAQLRWLVCEQTCVPGEGKVELTLATGDGGEAANVEVFAKVSSQLPKTAAPPFAVKWETKADAVTVHLAGLARETKAEFLPLPPTGVIPGHPKTSEIAADGSRSITLPIGEDGSPTIAWKGVIATTKADGTREGWIVGASPGSVATTSPSTTTPTSGGGSFLLKLLAAFVGGMIMNVMPCVLPVIALKIFGFVGQGRQDPGRVFRLGLAFNAGVFAFFLGLAAAVARLKLAFNFGYQFQNPYLLVGIIALVFVFALSLIGVFEISLGSGASSKLSELSGREGYGGAFLHGLFTTLLGTSCTAPFLAGSLSYAATQSTPVIFLLFAAIAAGMCLPYFLLTARPAWLRYLPKPGAWMERMKQVMGFIMLALAVWLFSILGLRGAEVVGGMSWFLFALGFAAWIFGTFRDSTLARIATVAVPVLAYFLFLSGKLETRASANDAGGRHWKTGGIEWTAFTDERLAEARKAGSPVFLDFTAEWCINCKTYERLVLSTDPVGAKFQEKKVVALRADWTNTDDPVVTRALKSFGRVGVPLYVLYRPGEDQPVVLDALTTGSLLAELDRIKP